MTTPNTEITVTEPPALPERTGTVALTSRIAKQSWNIAAEDVTAHTKHYDPEARDLLRWLHSWAIISRPAKSINEAADAVGVDRTTLYRVYTGKYRKEGTGACILPTKLINGIIALKRVEDLRRDKGKVPFVETATTKRIWKALDLCLERGRIGMIWGDSQYGKTSALREYQRRNNHGTTKYICLTPGGGVHELLRSLAKACGISPNSSWAELKDRIAESLDQNNLVIVDEVHQTSATYQRRSKVTCIEILRWIHDQSGCGMMLVGTNIWKDMLERDRDSKALEQIARRGAVKLQLPDKIPSEDLQAFYTAFELEPPQGEIAKIMRQLADTQGLTVVIEVLAFGQRQAKKRGNEFPNWDEVQDAYEILYALETGTAGR